MREDYELVKYQGKWAVYDKVSRTYSYVGCGKRECMRKVSQLNDRL